MTKNDFTLRVRHIYEGSQFDTAVFRDWANDVRPFDPQLATLLEGVSTSFAAIRTHLDGKLEGEPGQG